MQRRIHARERLPEAGSSASTKGNRTSADTHEPISPAAAPPDLTELLYDAALAPHLWNRFVDALAQEIGAPSVMLHLYTPAAGDPGVAVSCGLSAGFVHSYAEHFFASDPWLDAGRDLPAGALMPLLDLHIERLTAHPFYLRWMRPQQLSPFATLAGALLKQRDRVLASLHIFQLGSSASGHQAGVSLLRRLMPHLQRAVVIHRQLMQSEQRSSALAAALDRLDLGVLLVENDGRLQMANRRGRQILSTADGLQLGANGLQALQAAASAQLHKVLVRLTAPGPETVELLALPRAAGRPPLLVLAQRGEPWPSRLPGRPPVTLFVRRSDETPEIPAQVLQQLYALTPAEIRLAQQIGQGLSLDAAAERLHIKRETARVQLRHIFAKTGVSRQAELVCLLLRLPAGLGL